MTTEELCRKAVEMIEMAYAPYSHFRVGAAVECDDGTVYTGCNIENAAFTPTNCAERTAIFKAVSEGRRRFRRIAVAAETDSFTPPCGVCRQVMAEFSPDIDVLMVNRKGEVRTVPLRQLLPCGFDSTSLSDASPKKAEGLF